MGSHILSEERNIGEIQFVRDLFDRFLGVFQHIPDIFRRIVMYPFQSCFLTGNFTGIR